MTADAATRVDDRWREASVSSAKTVLPFIVWISSGQGVRHAARVKVARDLSDLPGQHRFARHDP